jgi:16S rRNA (cytosine967-C5)-methyltransferase
MKPGQLRAQAATILSKLLQQQGSLATLLERPLIDAQEFPLLQEICFGTCRWYFQLDAMLAQLLEKPLKPKDLDVRCLLLTGLYQLHYLRVPEYAVVNETVAATLVLKKQWAKGFVNAILRSYLRDKDEIASRALLKEPGRFAHPQWFISRMKAAWPETLAGTAGSQQSASADDPARQSWSNLTPSISGRLAGGWHRCARWRALHIEHLP